MTSKGSTPQSKNRKDSKTEEDCKTKLPSTAIDLIEQKLVESSDEFEKIDWIVTACASSGDNPEYYSRLINFLKTSCHYELYAISLLGLKDSASLSSILIEELNLLNHAKFDPNSKAGSECFYQNLFFHSLVSKTSLIQIVGLLIHSYNKGRIKKIENIHIILMYLIEHNSLDVEEFVICVKILLSSDILESELVQENLLRKIIPKLVSYLSVKIPKSIMKIFNMMFFSSVAYSIDKFLKKIQMYLTQSDSIDVDIYVSAIMDDFRYLEHLVIFMARKLDSKHTISFFDLISKNFVHFPSDFELSDLNAMICCENPNVLTDYLPVFLILIRHILSYLWYTGTLRKEALAQNNHYRFLRNQDPRMLLFDCLGSVFRFETIHKDISNISGSLYDSDESKSRQMNSAFKHLYWIGKIFFYLFHAQRWESFLKECYIILQTIDSDKDIKFNISFPAKIRIVEYIRRLLYESFQLFDLNSLVVSQPHSLALFSDSVELENVETSHLLIYASTRFEQCLLSDACNAALLLLGRIFHAAFDRPNSYNEYRIIQNLKPKFIKFSFQSYISKLHPEIQCEIVPSICMIEYDSHSDSLFEYCIECLLAILVLDLSYSPFNLNTLGFVLVMAQFNYQKFEKLIDFALNKAKPPTSMKLCKFFIPNIHVVAILEQLYATLKNLEFSSDEEEEEDEEEENDQLADHEVGRTRPKDRMNNLKSLVLQQMATELCANESGDKANLFHMKKHVTSFLIQNSEMILEISRSAQNVLSLLNQ